MIHRNSELSLVNQRCTLDIARSGVYYQPKPASEVDQMLMRLIDEIHLAKPFLGIRRLKDALYDLGIVSSHWVLIDRELRPLAFKIQCVALATEIREVNKMC